MSPIVAQTVADVTKEERREAAQQLDKQKKIERIEKAKSIELTIEFINEVFEVVNAEHDIEFMRKKDGYRFGLAYIVSCWLCYGKRHAEDSQAVAIHHDYMHFFFGARGIEKLAHVFDYPKDWSRKHELTRPIKPKVELQEPLRKMTNTARKGSIRRFNADKIHTVRAGRLVSVPYRPKRDASLSIDGAPVIDIERLKAGQAALERLIRRPYLPRSAVYADEIQQVTEHLEQYVKRNPRDTVPDLLHNWAQVRLHQARSLIHAADSAGRVKQKYYECSVGRWFSRGTSSLQAASKLIRITALAGCTEYDFHASHYVLLAHVAKQAKVNHGKDIEHNSILRYIKHKDAFRQGLAQRLGITAGHAKTLIARLPCGGGISAANDLDMTAEQGALLLSDVEYAQLYNEVRAVTRFMISPKFTPVDKYNRTIRNAAGLCMEAHRPSPERKSSILHGLEAVVTQSGMRAHTIGMDAPVLILHDGWATREAQDVQDALDAIHTDTGITVRINRPTVYMPSGMA